MLSEEIEYEGDFKEDSNSDKRNTNKLITHKLNKKCINTFGVIATRYNLTTNLIKNIMSYLTIKGYAGHILLT